MMKKIILLLIAISVVLIFLTRSGIALELQLLSERMHFGCYSINHDRTIGCMNQYYNKLTERAGPTIAMKDVRDGYDKYPDLRHLCHQVTHVIGRAAAARGDSLGVLFAEGDPFCWSGYYHGAVEGKLRGISTVRITSEFVNNFCRDIPKTESNYFHYFNCVHGTGHAFMYVSHNDLPFALSRCETFIAGDDKQNCAAGAFMENIVASQNEHNTKFIRANEPYFPCTIVNTLFIDTCYTAQATLIWQNTKYPKDAFRLCEEIPDTPSKHSCVEGLGREIAAGSMNTTAETIKGCEAASSSDTFSTCIIGAMKNFISYYHDDVLAKELCRSIDISTQIQCDTERSAFIKLFASTTTAIQ